MPKHSTHSWLYRPLYPNIGSQCYISIYILFYEVSRCKPASFPVCSHKMFVIVTATQPTIANLPQWQSSLPWANCHEAKLSCLKTRWLVRSTLWLFNIAMENGPFIEGLPINSMVIFYGYVSHNQMVIIMFLAFKNEKRLRNMEYLWICTNNLWWNIRWHIQ